MDTEHIKKKYEQLYRFAFLVRHHQIRFRKYRTGVDWDKAQYYERQLDKLLNGEKKLKESLLQELF
jgi:hypothetical protein